MACPTVAGVVATLLQRFPNYTPRQIRDQLIRESTSNAVNMRTFRGSGLPTVIAQQTPNRFAYAGRCGNSKGISCTCKCCVQLCIYVNEEKLCVFNL